MPTPRARLSALAVGAIAVGSLALVPLNAHAGASPAFSAHYVSTTLAGGEPFVIYSHGAKDLVYSAHEGTTHIDQTYTTTPGSSCDIKTQTGFLCSYHNQLNNWFSTDGGSTWTLSTQNPINTGFSDPSLTEDEGNNLYDTGIDLANDALYTSQDGGRTWPTGTPQCSPGDRPWLAGGKPGEVFLSTNTETSGTQLFHGLISTQSTPAGPVSTLSCSQNGIPDYGSGQIYYDHATGDVIEPEYFGDGGSGIAVLPKASSADFSSSTTTPFQQYESKTLCTKLATACNGGFGFNAIAIDSGNTTYVVWGNGPRAASGSTGCGSVPNQTGGPPLLRNQIYMIWTSDEGRTWSDPKVIADPGTTVLWPWITAGAAGDVSVVWYQGDQITDPDCDSAALASGGHPTRWTLQVANIMNATSPTTAYPPASVNAVATFNDGNHPGGVLHVGGICQSGTTCAATGQDRRLGDYFTNALDQNGCVMIATADTMLTDSTTGGQFSTGRPLFLEQTAGPSLTTGLPCGQPSANTPEAPLVPVLVVAGAAGVLVVTLTRGRRRRPAHTSIQG